MGSSQKNKSRVSPSLWLTTLARSLQRTTVGVFLMPVGKETKRGLGLLRRRFRHTVALVGIPWGRIGAVAVVLIGLGFVAFQPRNEVRHSAATTNRPSAHVAKGVGVASTSALPPSPTSNKAIRVTPSPAIVTASQPVTKTSRPIKKVIPAKPKQRLSSVQQKHLERRRQSYHNRVQKWHKKHHKRKHDDD